MPRLPLGYPNYPRGREAFSHFVRDMVQAEVAREVSLGATWSKPRVRGPSGSELSGS